MKKILLSLSFVISGAMAAMAAVDNPVQFLVWISESSKTSNGDQLACVENPKYKPQFDKSRDSQKMARTSGHTYVYNEFNVDTILGVIATNNLEGTYITFESTAATEYELYFQNVTMSNGRKLYVLDTETNKKVSITATDTLKFSAAPNAKISKRFQIVSVEPQLCFQFDRLLIVAHRGETLKVLDAKKEVAIPEQTLATDEEIIDLSSLSAGHYYVVLNGETFIIQVNPALMPAK